MGQVGPATLELIDREVEVLVRAAEEDAVSVLEANWASVEEVANALLAHETLAGVALDAVLAGVRPVSPPDGRDHGGRERGVGGYGSDDQA